jgi:hypothetical protein
MNESYTDIELKPIAGVYLKDIKNVNKALDYYKIQTLNSISQHSTIKFQMDLYIIYGLLGVYKVIGGKSNIIDKFCKDSDFVAKVAAFKNVDRLTQVNESYGYILSAYLFILSNKVSIVDVQRNPKYKGKSNTELAVAQISTLNKKLTKVFSDRADAINRQSIPFIRALTLHDITSKQLADQYQQAYGSIYSGYSDAVSEFIVGKNNYKCRENSPFIDVLTELTTRIL